MRRAAIAPFFARQKIRDLEPMVQEKIDLLKTKLLDRAKTGEILDMQRVYAALSLDIITQHALGESWEALERPDLGAAITNAIQSMLVLHPFGRAFPFAMRIIEGSLSWLITKFEDENDYGSSPAGFLRYIRKATSRVYDRALDEKGLESSGEAPIIYKVIRESSLPEPEKSLSRMAAETVVLTSAGTDTTARTLAIASYYILSDPAIHARLLAELRTVIPAPGAAIPSHDALEKLPYLTGVILESLRLANSVPQRLSRIAPDEDLRYGECIIPRGTTFGQSNWFLHANANCFPEPEAFVPDRWSSPDAERQRRYLVPFGRGTRMCLGLNLAYAEMYRALATVVSDVEMELFETTARDIT
jgi:cytochrome P450